MGRVLICSAAIVLALPGLAAARPIDPAGCLVPGGSAACANSGALTTPGGLLVTANAVYVTAGSVGPAQGAGVATFNRNPTTGALTRTACIGETGDGVTCANGHGLALGGDNLAPSDLAMNPAGTRVYVASPGSDAIAVLKRNPATGTLTQDGDATGCISQLGDGGCANGRGLVDKLAVGLSPDGASLYAAGNGAGGGGVAWLKTDAALGLTQDPNPAACFTQTADAECTTIPPGQFQGGTGIAVSPDGSNVYASSFTSSSVLTFGRVSTGALVLTGCLRGSATAGCTTAPELFAEVATVRFASNTQLWVAISNKDNGFASGRFQRLDRTPGTGALAVSPTACVSATNVLDSCGAKSPYLFTAKDIAFTADGTSAYTGAQLRMTVTAFNRAGSGGLARVAGPRGCYTAFAVDPACNPLTGIDGPSHVETSPDGRFVYVVSVQGFEANIDGIGIFRRELPPAPGGGGGGGGGPKPPPPPDTVAPTGKLSGKLTQKVGSSVAVGVLCLTEDCTASAEGSIDVPTGKRTPRVKRFKHKRVRKSIPKGSRKTIKLKVSKKARRAIKAALKKRRRVRAKLKVTLRDASGNARVLRRTIKLKR